MIYTHFIDIAKTALENKDSQQLQQLKQEIESILSNGKIYQFFEVDSNIEQSELDKHLKLVGRKLAFLHPDKFSSLDKKPYQDWANEVYANIQAMLETLKNPEKRAEYDSNPFQYIETQFYHHMDILREAAQPQQEYTGFNLSDYMNFNTKKKGTAYLSLLDVFFKDETLIQYILHQEKETCLHCLEKGCNFCQNQGFIHKKHEITLDVDKQWLKTNTINYKDYELNIEWVDNDKWTYHNNKLWYLAGALPFNQVINNKLELMLLDKTVIIDIKNKNIPNNTFKVKINNIDIIVKFDSVQF